MAEHPEESPQLFTLKLDGSREMKRGSEVSFKRERGRFRFKWARETMHGMEVTVYGGTKHYQSYRTFPASRVKTVHVKEKIRK